MPKLAVRRSIDRRAIARLAAVGVPSLGIATVVVGVLETAVGVPDASVVYITAVVAVAIATGTAGAVATAMASFLLYDFFFVQPLYTFTIRDPAEWLSVILLLFVGIVVGQLAAIQRRRTEDARAREREARALFAISRALVTRDSTPAVLPTIARILRDEARMRRVWIALGPEVRERTVADTDEGRPPGTPAMQWLLHRTPGDELARWLRVHQPAPGRAPAGVGLEAYRVRIEAAGVALGSVWALRERALDEPDRTETRLLAAGADQLGQALAHDRLAAEARAAEIARQSDELKSALLQSVSHDLRTPLATIRAAAGSLRPDSGLDPTERTESVDAIDREVGYLDRLVTNLLDLSRIEAGSLRPERDAFDLDDLVGPTIERLAARLTGRRLGVALDAPPVMVDPVFVGEAVANVLENAVRHTPPDSAVAVHAERLAAEPFVRLTIEDAGPGVPADSLDRLFDKFYRVPGTPRTSRSGTGIGLAVTRGLIEATGGRVAARASELGGLAIDLDLPLASVPAELAAGQCL